ncbi:MAG: nuclear transport factor 2 family protein [Gemmatimonadetes bacterium]|nr:nuclear transport factor 2 family protein [Gemmatimonadota bacterium]
MRPGWIIAALAAFTGCAPALAGGRAESAGTAAARQAVVLSAEALFSAMRARDTTALRGMFTPEARIVSVRVQGGAEPVVQTRGISDFIASIGRGTDELRERMWDPRVEVEGEVATLWAPYDFHVGERFSHCGIDAFDYVRTSHGWKIVALSYTVQATGCAPAPGAR